MAADLAIDAHGFGKVWEQYSPRRGGGRGKLIFFCLSFICAPHFAYFRTSWELEVFWTRDSGSRQLGLDPLIIGWQVRWRSLHITHFPWGLSKLIVLHPSHFHALDDSTKVDIPSAMIFLTGGSVMIGGASVMISLTRGMDTAMATTIRSAMPLATTFFKLRMPQPPHW